MKHFSSLERNFSSVEWLLKKCGSRKNLNISEAFVMFVRWFCISEAQFSHEYQSRIAVSQTVLPFYSSSFYLHVAM